MYSVEIRNGNLFKFHPKMTIVGNTNNEHIFTDTCESAARDNFTKRHSLSIDDMFVH